MTVIGIVVPTLGTRGHWLRQTLWSIRTQQGPHDVRLLIVCPDARSVSAAASEVDAEILESPRPGLSAAVNDGFKSLTSVDALAWLGDDDILAPGSFLASINALFASGVVATYGDVRYIDERGTTLFVTRPGRFASIYLPWGKDLVPQPGSLFRANAVNQVGLVDESLRWAMDFEYFLRLKRLGALRYIPQEVAAFRLHSTGITSNQTGFEAEEVRSKYHSPAMNRVRRIVAPAQRQADRVLYRALRRGRHTPVPLIQGEPYVTWTP
ncbi:glycosyltransferase [Nocardioides oceani]|uniref:glycosyltransferase n=1 Tax=Nocardioides oceani TaxID=3058369 RepID=UPI0034DE80CB